MRNLFYIDKTTLLALFIVVITSAGFLFLVNEVSPQENNPTAKESVLENQTSEDEYLSVMSSESKELKRLLRWFETTLKSDLRSRNEFEDALVQVRQFASLEPSVSPPTRYTKIHQDYLEAMDLLISMCDQLESGFQFNDKKTMEDGIEDFNEAIDLLIAYNKFVFE